MRKIKVKNRNELNKIVENLMLENNLQANLNHLDVSAIEDMSEMFAWSDFNGDISEWDVSNVNNMNQMFINSLFDGDLSKWDVSNVISMSGIFEKCPVSKSNKKGGVCSWVLSSKVNEEIKSNQKYLGFDFKHCIKQQRYKQLGSFQDLMRFDD